ncbi:MAG: helix-turn-helix transcriptional regulator [Parasporobacterium sp.]|nr:helix-turn-helix transcriptional regulator [Parasporobacterium sp.]
MEYLCRKALKIIETDYRNEELSLNQVSRQLHVSPNYLSANMKKYTGDTFINLLIRKRMEAAKDLVQNGSLRIAEVAFRCGYSDQHYFSYCFKKYYGISPAGMRAKKG